MSVPSAVPPAQEPFSAGNPLVEKTREKQQFYGLAWTSLILGIVGVVGSPVTLFNNLTAIAAGVGIILGGIALFGVKKLVALIGLVLSIAAIVFTVLAQQALSKEIDKTFDEIGKSIENLQP